MISVGEAKEIIKLNTQLLSPEILSLEKAAGCLLADNVYALADFPAFPQSSVDGYAIRYEDLVQNTFLIHGEAQAGGSGKIKTEKNQAVRIFTGASMPQGADTVVMQEKVAITDCCLQVLDDQLLMGSNVRPKGSEIVENSLALPKGTLLSPAAISFMAGLGYPSLPVIPKPQVGIIVTGKELRPPGTSLQNGQVYESNSHALTAALAQWQISVMSTQLLDDEEDLIGNELQTILSKADLILITGGISVGDYDHVAKALEKCGVEKLFHKIQQRPGKPLYFGKKKKKLVFGLPGNPSSVLTCFYEYVLPALQYMTGREEIALRTVQLPLASGYTKNAALTHFLKGIRIGDTVMPLDAQESYRMKSFAMANCLIVLEKDKNFYKEGQLVEVHLLP